MEFNLNKLIICITVVICISHTVYTIKCWDCRSDNDPKCADPFDNSTLAIKDCSQEPELSHLPGAKASMCRKIRQKFHGKWRYFRSCAYMGEPGIELDERFCLMRTGSYNIFMEYCTCSSKDGCNTGGQHIPNKNTIFISTLLIFSMAYLLSSEN